MSAALPRRSSASSWRSGAPQAPARASSPAASAAMTRPDPPPAAERLRQSRAHRLNGVGAEWADRHIGKFQRQWLASANWRWQSGPSLQDGAHVDRFEPPETCGAAECLANGLPSPDRHQLNDLGELVLQPQRAGRGGGAQKRLRSGPQAEERNLGWGPRANTARGSPIGIGQVAEGHLARTDRIVADHLAAS